MLFVLFIGGVIAGLYGSVVGGGALVTFPLLILFGLPTNLAIATNRLSGALLEGAGALRFYCDGKFRRTDLKAALALGGFAIFGSILGSMIMLKIDEVVLRVIVAVMLAACTGVILLRGNRKQNGSDTASVSLLVSCPLAFGLSIYGGFFGAGYGTFITILLFWCGYGFLKSAALSRFVGFLMSLAAVFVFAYQDTILYVPGCALAAGSGLGAWIGAGIAVKKGEVYVRTLLTTIALLSVAKLLGPEILSFFK